MQLLVLLQLTLILKVTGSIQLCTGQDAGIESAIHVMNTMFQVESTEATVLIDVTIQLFYILHSY